MMPLSMPMEVMPTCTDDDRKTGSGCPAPATLRRPLSPASASGGQAGLAAGRQRQLRHREHGAEREQRDQQKSMNRGRIDTMALFT